MDTVSTIGKHILRPAYLKIKLTGIHRSYSKEYFEFDTKIVWIVQAFHGCIDTSMSDLKYGSHHT
jgi:hypothetical protein